MKPILLFPIAISVLGLPMLHGQAVPTASPSIAPPGTVSTSSSALIAGEFNYSLTASESYVTGYQGATGSGSSTNISGQAIYSSNSETHPLSVIYAGGYFFGNGSDVTASSFQNLGVSQILSGRRWRMGVGDTITFLPSSSLYGLSGVPGSGDIGTTPITTGQIPTQSILTNYGQQVTNTASASLSRDITGKTFIDGFGSYSLQRFLQQGLNNNSVSASASLGHRFDPRTSLSVGYTYLKSSIRTPVSGLNSFSFVSDGLTASFSHAFNRKFSMQVSGGPQWLSSDAGSLVPNRTIFSTSASLSYAGQRNRASISYSRIPNIGSGVVTGALSDNLNFTLNRAINRVWTGGLTANYGRASGLATLPGQNIVTNSFYGGVQATRRIGQNFSAFGSYSAATQSLSNQAATLNAFNGTAQIVTVGLTYSPRSIRFGRP